METKETKVISYKVTIPELLEKLGIPPGEVDLITTNYSKEHITIDMVKA